MNGIVINKGNSSNISIITPSGSSENYDIDFIILEQCDKTIWKEREKYYLVGHSKKYQLFRYKYFNLKLNRLCKC
jgi:helix-turn-helix protein